MKRTSSAQPSRQTLEALHDGAYRWALACCGYEEDSASEVMQMVYLAILSERAVFDGRSSLKTWLFGVVRNTALRLAVSARRTRAMEDRLAHLAAEPVPTSDGAAQLANGQARRAILQAVRGLSPQQRQVVELVYYHDLSVAEAATVMGTGLGSARQHFHRAKRALAGSLRPLKDELGDD